MQKVKYLIVGQGLAGTLLSFFLYKEQIPHLVIAAKTLPSASNVAAGIYNPLVFRRLTKSWMIDELLPEMIKTYSELELLLSVKLIYQKPVAKFIQPTEKEWWLERIHSERLHNYFDGFKKADEVLGMNNSFELAIIKNSGYVDLSLLLLKYRTFLESQHALIVEDFKYPDLLFDGKEVSWKGIKAQNIIFCEGSFAINNPFFPTNVFYLAKGDVLLAEIPGLSEKFILNKDVFILPKGDQKFLIGSTYERENLNWEPQAENIPPLLAKAQNLVQYPINIIGHYVGVRPTVKDRRPVLGIHPKHNSIAFFNGLGTKGVMLAPYFANEMVNHLEYENYQLPTDISLNRFI